MFTQKSYDLHGEWYNQHFPTTASKIDYYNKIKQQGDTNLSYWLQQIFFNCLDPFLKVKGQSWLTIGDAYGFDAQYILANGGKALATDLTGDFLEVAREQNVIDEYSVQNAESLSFADEHFDYVLCKESYHHFPRPYAALYEMMRVAKKGIVIIEPQDPVSKMPALLALTNLLSTQTRLLNKAWKNRFSYEPVGNFVYKVSEREFEKFAAGLNLPMVAFKNINPNFYFKGAENITAVEGNKVFRSIKKRKSLLDQLVKLKIIPGQVLATVIFKQVPDELTLQLLKADGYHVVAIPPNPYLV
jgi:ubiquinone/menaquinone biosynthesis C-methylase UbiE